MYYTLPLFFFFFFTLSSILSLFSFSLAIILPPPVCRIFSYVPVIPSRRRATPRHHVTLVTHPFYIYSVYIHSHTHISSPSRPKNRRSLDVVQPPSVAANSLYIRNIYVPMYIYVYVEYKGMYICVVYFLELQH